MVADVTTSRWLDEVRRAAINAPVSDPMARIEPRMPYSPAPLSYTWVAINAVVIWKLKPNVPATNRIAITSMMSGRERT